VQAERSEAQRDWQAELYPAPILLELNKASIEIQDSFVERVQKSLLDFFAKSNCGKMGAGCSILPAKVLRSKI